MFEPSRIFFLQLAAASVVRSKRNHFEVQIIICFVAFRWFFYVAQQRTQPRRSYLACATARHVSYGGI